MQTKQEVDSLELHHLNKEEPLTKFSMKGAMLHMQIRLTKQELHKHQWIQQDHKHLLREVPSKQGVHIKNL